ncbi:hypothetical protein IQ287_38110 [Burkholderia sp. R-69927]|nr:hypothetical protein [Paraburkholderia domus]MBK5091746.1 hypothetical protein [Burkholderia sp. R-69927]
MDKQTVLGKLDNRMFINGESVGDAYGEVIPVFDLVDIAAATTSPQ